MTDAQRSHPMDSILSVMGGTLATYVGLAGAMGFGPTGSFAITSTGPNPPDVSSVTDLGSNRFKVTLTAPIKSGQWTTIRAVVNDADGNLIRTDPLDRVDLGFLPGDANANATTNGGDVTFIDDQLANPPQSPDLVSLDQDRCGQFNSTDRTRCVRLQQGYHTSQAWTNVSLPTRP